MIHLINAEKPETEAFIPKVGEGVTEILYTDRYVYTIIEVSKSKKKITIQEDKAILIDDPGNKPEFIQCGFAAHCTNNNSLKYRYERNKKGKIKKATLRKDGVWRISGCSTTGKLIAGRHYKYDYNF